MKTIKFFFYFALFTFVLMSFTGCKSDEPKTDGTIGTVTDIDGNVYKTVTIGTQTWMVDNLRTTKYRNGSLINVSYIGDTLIVNNANDSLKLDTIKVKYLNDMVNVTSQKDLKISANLINGVLRIITKGDTISFKAKKGDIDVTGKNIWTILNFGAQCTYNNTLSIDTITKFGRLYNSYALTDSRNIAPTGWHVPTKDEWLALQDYVSANFGTSGSSAKALAATGDWTTSSDLGAIGNDLTINNSLSFSAVPAGCRKDNAQFVGIGLTASLWSSSNGPYLGSSWYLGLLNYYKDALWSTYNVNYGLSIRCIKDSK